MKENLDYSTAQSSGTIAPPSRSNVAPSAVKPIPPNLSGNAIAGYNIASAADVLSQQPIPPISQKNVEKNQLLVKSTNRSRYAPSGVSNNLVIRFSDDDSGSDLEECSRQKPVENKSNSTWDGSQRPLTASAQKMNKLGQTSRNITRVIPKKSLSRTFISSEVNEKNANNESSNQDSLLFEASLRSELFARLEVRTSSKNIDSCYNEPYIEREAEMMLKVKRPR